ncbi:PTS sugar transporter subunit IIA [Oceanobacillus halophilus]|uniref:PTS glucose transporter subunit IIA n=1 Tax=Oceanobacillus halophilus TaxID=930130 RepID=A0A494ZZV7_9BACI|nr:PTS glucose transporter subunit IIA [Oceanobacillus halophilus]RKQ32523.1 PTS glucose transporter subunit IIA [Oceanobacillus halophilus]
MLKKLFKKSKEAEEIYAPINGEVVPLEEVPDPVFSQKMMGEGVAINSSEGEVVSPVAGKIVQIPDSKHAIGLETENGTEILIHIGLETVALNGEGFTPKVRAGDKVTVGQPLMSFDLEYIRENASSVITPMIITNSGDLNKDITQTEEKAAKAGETVLLTISGK